MTFYISPYAPRAMRRMVVQQDNAARPLPVEVRDEDEAYVLTAFVPGLKAEDLTIQVLEDAISIEGEYKRSDGEALLSELPFGAFRRALRLPAALDADKAEAKIEDGILTLHLPKAESARPKTIKVSYN
jgi:HSP20 family protein